MFKQTFIKENFPKPHDNMLFCRYVVSDTEFEAISTYLDITAGIDRKLCDLRLKIARTKTSYLPKFDGDPNLSTDDHFAFYLSCDDADYFDVRCWGFVQRKFEQTGFK